MNDIKSMKLYNNVERVYNELQELDIGTEDDLSAEDLSAFDQLHYHGTDALDRAIELMQIKAGQAVLEIGSGIGGPSRYLAKQTNAAITALELQDDQNELALALSQRCGITSNLRHVCGDFLSHDWHGQQFDFLVSWLALYHIPSRVQLLSRCFDILKPGGLFYTEDLFARRAFDNEELVELERELYAITLPDPVSYREQIETAGFEIVLLEDMSDDWSEFTHQRLNAYRSERARHIRVHGEATFNALEIFYTAVDKYFQSGKLGGIRLCARKI